MSQRNEYGDAQYSQAATGGVEGLALGAPLGGGSSTTGGQIGSGGLLSGNTTRGYENDQSQIGDNVGSGAYGTGAGTGGYSSGLGQSDNYASSQRQTGDLLDSNAAVQAGMGAGHHEQNLSSTGDVYQSRDTGDSYGGRQTTGDLGNATGSGYGQQTGDSYGGVTGGQGYQQTGDSYGGVTGGQGYSQTGDSYAGQGQGQGLQSGSGADIGYGGDANVPSDRGITGQQTQTRSSGLGRSSGGAGPSDELREELDMHKDGQGIHDVHHAESQGPHGLVFDEASGKYLHRRELDGKGSTGVPLK